MQEKNIDDIWNKRPFIVSGPCSAETEEQVLQTAQQLSKINNINIFRAGIWKPRTRPGQFEGVGPTALEWLSKVKEYTGLLTTTEVATAKHIDDALKNNIDIIWIGARTTANPFSVQEIADSLKGIDIPVMIKNPINPDLDLWIGAVERIAKSGINKIALIHRGFSSYGNTKYRNAPMWHLAIEMKRRYPSLIFICDPSHICGKRETIQSIAQTSINLGYDGLMIETHISPDKALSDANQQITPSDLEKLLRNLIWRNENIDNEDLFNTIEKMRQQINHIDDELMGMLSIRMKIVDEIGQYKKQNDITILQTNRWNEILERAYKRCETLGLSKEFITKYFDAIHMESIHHQNKIMNS
ncbi:MAG: bifunctional 3-deoxy-7-phosphoheptulonate synthase/chorismate mutase type II [Chitinophagales bacterium]|nr:bifunctional 3-deoxy-7-phosphoheptulonate synthase/chorismate mutase type II [Chitinophagales bacterium]